MHKSLFVSLVVLVTSITSCHPRDGAVRTTLLDIDGLATANPVEDLSAAISAGDKRFFGLHEMGEFVPGAEDHPELTEKYGVRYIEGTSDTTNKKLQDEAFEYCRIYNLLLVLRHSLILG